MPVLKVGEPYKFEDEVWELVGVEGNVAFIKKPDSTAVYDKRASISELIPVDQEWVYEHLNRPIIMDAEDKEAWEKWLEEKNGDKDVRIQ